PGLELPRPATVREADGGTTTGRLEQWREHVDEGQLGDRRGARALDAAELHERALTGAAAEADGGDRHVQRCELVVGEPEVGQVVLLRIDPVPGLGIVADVADGYPHRTKGRLVALERPAGRGRVRRVAECGVGHEVVA